MQTVGVGLARMHEIRNLIDSRNFAPFAFPTLAVDRQQRKE